MSNGYVIPDFLQLQEELKKLRDMDDKLVTTLNVSLPTESFKGQVDPEANCKELLQKLRKGYEDREYVIKQNISAYSNKLKQMSNEPEAADDFNANKEYKAARRKMLMLQSELAVEDILRERALKVFNEKCRKYHPIEKL